MRKARMMWRARLGTDGEGWRERKQGQGWLAGVREHRWRDREKDCELGGNK